MKTVKLVQGSPEWHAHRREYDNASDTPIVLGESEYKTRDQFMYEMHTGITKEVDAGTQKLFDNGHKFEALARPIAEKIIGDELSPTVGVNGNFSASFDGITFMGDVIFEHKTLNEKLRAVFADIETRAPEYRENSGDLLPAMYRVQMEHQLMVSGAEKCLFMASKWNGETLDEERHTWYYPDLKLRQRIIDGWAKFKADLAAYVPPTVVEKVEASTVQSMPVPSVVVRGEITTSNMNEITPIFDNYLANIKTDLKTDQDFADAEENAKNCEDAEQRIKALRGNIIAQMADVNKVDTELGNYQEAFRKMKVALKNAVIEQKDKIKADAVLVAKNKYLEYIGKLQAEIVGVTLHQKLVCPDFAKAIKGVRKLESLHANINEALNAGILDAEALARDVRTKLAYLEEATKGYEGLFADKQSFIFGDMEYIKLLVKTRIDDQKTKDAQREAQIKAKAEAEALAKAEKARFEDLQAKQQPVNEVKPLLSQSESVNHAISSVNPTQDQVAQHASNLTTLPKAMEAEFGKVFQPTAHEIVQIVARAKQVDEQLAHKWLLNTDFATMMQKAA